jgi:hypothetical protein
MEMMSHSYLGRTFKFDTVNGYSYGVSGSEIPFGYGVEGYTKCKSAVKADLGFGIGEFMRRSGGEDARS